MATDLGRNTDIETLVSERIRAALVEVHTATAGRIVSYDAATQTATVQVSLDRQFEDDAGGTENVPIPPILDVPVLFPRAGGWALTFPVQPGDPCLVVFGERDMGGWKQNGAQAAPPTSRAHDYSDAVAILGLWPSSDPMAPAPSGTALQLRNEAGTTKIDLSALGILLQTAAAITAQATGNVGVTATGALSLTGTTDLSLLSVANATIAAAGTLLLSAGGILTISPVGGLALAPTGPVTITRGANELLQILSEALDEIGTSTAGGDPLTNAAAIAALKAKIDAMRA